MKAESSRTSSGLWRARDSAASAKGSGRLWMLRQDVAADHLVELAGQHPLRPRVEVGHCDGDEIVAVEHGHPRALPVGDGGLDDRRAEAQPLGQPARLALRVVAEVDPDHVRVLGDKGGELGECELVGRRVVAEEPAHGLAVGGVCGAGGLLNLRRHAARIGVRRSSSAGAKGRLRPRAVGSAPVLISGWPITHSSSPGFSGGRHSGAPLRHSA